MIINGLQCKGATNHQITLLTAQLPNSGACIKERRQTVIQKASGSPSQRNYQSSRVIFSNGRGFIRSLCTASDGNKSGS